MDIVYNVDLVKKVQRQIFPRANKILAKVVVHFIDILAFKYLHCAECPEAVMQSKFCTAHQNKIIKNNKFNNINKINFYLVK